MAKRREIRNSTAEFLIFQIEGKEQGIEVYYKNKTVWCTQKAMGMLFDCTSDNISVHLQNIYVASGLLSSASGPQVYFVNMPFVVMCWTGNEWRMAHSWMRTTLNTC